MVPPDNQDLIPLSTFGPAVLVGLLESHCPRACLEKTQHQHTRTFHNQKEEKEVQVFTNALESLKSYWDGKMHNGFRVMSTAVHFRRSSGLYSDYARVKTMLDSNLRHVKEDSELQAYLEKCRFYVKHMDRR